jgi:WD40 repeat protein
LGPAGNAAGPKACPAHGFAFRGNAFYASGAGPRCLHQSFRSSQGAIVTTLRLLGASPAGAGHGGDVFACAFTSDSAFVLSSGWDGFLKLWDVQLGTPVAGFQADARPLSACAVSPDDRHWLCGSMDGLLGKWEANTHARAALFLAHTRPVSALRFSPAGNLLATASWDCGLTLWPTDRLGQGRPLGAHRDIVAGCAFTPDGKRLVSWGYDRAVNVWDVARPRALAELQGHGDRVTAGAVSPDGSWLVTGARDRQVKLWALQGSREVAATEAHGEVRACLFLRDAESVVVADAAGRLTVHGLPDLKPQAELDTGLPVQCAELSPSGAVIALGCGDGRVCFAAVEGFDRAPLAITVTQAVRESGGFVRRLLGAAKPQAVYLCTCPACRRAFELPGTGTGQPAACPGCHRSVRVCVVTPAAEPAVGS